MWQYKAVSMASLASLALVWGGSIWSRLVLHPTSASSPLILHFNDIDGITAVGAPDALAFMAVLGTVVVLLNFFITLELESRDRFLGKLTAAATLIFATLLFIGFAAIINVN